MALPNSFGNRQLLDPAHLLRDCLARNLPTANWHGRATVAHCPTGRRWGTYTVLMSLGELNRLDLTADLDLILSDFRQPVTLKRLNVLSAEAAVPGLKDDPATPYLVAAVDRRFHLDRSPFSKAYNLPDGAGGLIASSTDGGTPWTWATMFADLWGRLPATPAGAAPTLPFTPDGRPEGWAFWGHPSAWQALNDVLDRLCCVLVLDPTTDAITVERQGTADVAGAAFLAAAKFDLSWDGRPAVAKRTARPSAVTVRFRRDPAPPFGSDPYYELSISLTAAPGVVATTSILLTDDLIALGATGAPTNGVALAARAAERATDFERSLPPAEGSRVLAWRGLWPTAIAEVGANAGGVVWGDRGAGCTTELGPGDPPRLALPELGAAAGAGAGPCIDIQTKTCEDEYGVQTFEYRTICFPAGVTVSDPWCVAAQTDCCSGGPLTGTVPCDGFDYPDAWFSAAAVTNKTLDCTCVPSGLTDGWFGLTPGIDDHPYWTQSGCEGNPEWHLLCRNGAYELWVGGNYGDPTGGDAMMCEPISPDGATLKFRSPDLGDNCGVNGGTVDVTITP